MSVSVQLGSTFSLDTDQKVAGSAKGNKLEPLPYPEKHGMDMCRKLSYGWRIMPGVKQAQQEVFLGKVVKQ